MGKRIRSFKDPFIADFQLITNFVFELLRRCRKNWDFSDWRRYFSIANRFLLPWFHKVNARFFVVVFMRLLWTTAQLQILHDYLQISESCEHLSKIGMEKKDQWQGDWKRFVRQVTRSKEIITTAMLMLP